MNDPDKSDWSAFRAGDQRALERLYHRHRDRIFAFCLYVTGNPDLSADVVQETFLRLMQQDDSLRDIGSWLFITARNQLYTTLKRSQRESNVTPQDLQFADCELAPEQRLLLKNMLASLGTEERELLLLREYAGFSTAELAKTLEISPEALRVRLFRIRKKLRTSVEDER